MDILIFGGTTEGRQLAVYCMNHGISAIVSVATDYGGGMLPDSPLIKLLTGTLNQEEIGILLDREWPRLVIDATHPYATLVTRYVREECEKRKIQYTRVIRKRSLLGKSADNSLQARDSQAADSQSGIIWAEDAKKAADLLRGTKGNILVTTGSKEMNAFSDLKERIYIRVLPSSQVVALCEQAGYQGSHIIGMQGPFSKELNAAMIKQIHAAYLVTKESGGVGGFPEKLEAARECGVTVVIIGRPSIEEGETVEQVLKRLQPFAEGKRSQIFLIGVGMGGLLQMTVESIQALQQCDIIMGSARMLSCAAKAAPLIPREERYLRQDVMDWLENNKTCQKIGILYSGDPGFYSGARQIQEAVRDCPDQYDLFVYPGISSVSYFCSRLKINWEDARIVSCHGRECDILSEVKENHKVFSLLGGKESVKSLCQKLIEGGCETAELYIGERLSYPEERVVKGTPKELLLEEFDSLTVALICWRGES